MARYLILMIFITIATLTNCGSVENPKTGSVPVSHDLWDDLLQKHVKANGLVDYKGFISDSTLLNQYLDLLSSAYPNKKNWSRNERLAYWINAYNAFTVQLVIRNYPLESIRDIKGGGLIKGVWGIEFISIEGQKLSLHDIEHNILREKFNEPRIHFAINCASLSCPKLRNSAYTAKGLDRQLDEQAISFINDPSRNKIGKNELHLSKIFKWFDEDFTRNGDLVAFISKFTGEPISPDADISYLDYNWKLNE